MSDDPHPLDRVVDINHKDFFSDENMETLDWEPASYGDWAPGVGEAASVSRPRPLGDVSELPFHDGTEAWEAPK
jgi:hypothetical protein